MIESHLDGARRPARHAQTPRRLARVSIAAAAVLAATLAAAPVARAGALEGLASLFGAPAPAAAPDHVVTDGVVSPSGVTIDLFDYDANAVNEASDLNFVWNNYGLQGGNLGSDPACRRASINAWTGRWDRRQGGPYVGIVEDRLENGFPVLREGLIYHGESDRTSRSSLAHLFDPARRAPGVTAHHDVQGLLRLDDEGYYYYDSMENFASFDEETNAFTLYDAPGVKTDPRQIADVSVGQFFPFNTFDQVFTERGGKLQSDVFSHDKRMDHHFGLTMTSYFMQPVGGLADGDAMVFDFSGDDDVWVFIDDVLVGDVGGIHDRISLTIDFAKGEVVTRDASSYAKKPESTVFTTKRFDELFDASQLQDGRFKDNSYHTMKFFYLERGAKNSNLSLKTNLVQIPASTMTKVDQTGTPVPGARFALYRADEDYRILSDDPVSTGSTDAHGVFTFRDASGRPLNFLELHTAGASHFVLRETFAPAGYRKSPDAHLVFELSKDKTTGHLLSENYWDSGVYARAEKIITVVGDVVEDAAGREHRVEDGSVFGVILKRDRSAADDARAWHAVWGDSVGGWHLSGDPITDVRQLRDPALRHPFERDDNGKLVADIRELPGLPEQYYHMASEAARADGDYEYVVGLYFTTARDQASMDSSNTWRLGGEKHFERQSAAHLHVTDRANYVFLQKVDDTGAPINGVAFDAYPADAMTRDASGRIVPLAGAAPLESEQTADRAEGPDWDLREHGVATFGPFEPGTYYLVERASSVPAGYVPNPAAVRVVVDADGAHPDAGTAADGVYAQVGAGRILRSMAQFAQADGIESSLHDIVLQLQEPTGVSVDDTRLTASIDGWAPVASADPIELSYGTRDLALEYGPRYEGGPVAALVDEGYGCVRIAQNAAAAPDPSSVGLTGYTDLSGRDLTNLYSGAARVVVVNERVASLAVSKRVEVPSGLDTPQDMADAAFDVNFEVLGAPGESYKAATFKIVDGAEVQQGDAYRLKAGDSRQISHGETINVYGLPDGSAFKVTERIAAGSPYVQTAPQRDGAPAPVEGAVHVGKTARGEFVNTYAPTPATVGPESFGFEKHLDLLRFEGDRVVREEDAAWEHFTPEQATFTMRLSEVREGPGAAECPFPEGADLHEGDGGTYMTATVARDEALGHGEGGFGPIVFEAPGTYVYLITEDPPAPADKAPGLTYSRARYRVTVEVVDTGGALSATASMRQTFDEAGSLLPPDAQRPSERAVFRNSASFEATEAGPIATKVLDDRSGDHALAMGEFTFGWRPLTEGAPLLTDEHGAPGPRPEGSDYYTATNDASGGVSFGMARFTDADLNRTYVYELFEVVPAQAVNPAVGDGKVAYAEASPEQRLQRGWTYHAVTYDSTPVYYHVSLESGDAGDGVASVVATVSYRAGADADSAVLPEGAVFRNVYDPIDTHLVPRGEKTILGRGPLDGESFSFELVAGDADAERGLAEDAVVFGGDSALDALSVEVADLVEGEAHGFEFPAISFSRAGSYVFHIREAAPAAPAPGMSYDPARHSLIVEVVDAAGRLEVASAVYEDGTGETEPAACFTNRYEATGSLASGIEVAKVMRGRDLRLGEFSFSIVGIDGAGAAAAEADAKLVASDRSFTNPRAGKDKPAVMRRLTNLFFTQADAGKTFSYIIDEDDRADAELAGVTCDRSQFRVDVAVTDDGTGSLAVTPRITRVRDAQGAEVDQPVEGLRATFENFYKPLPATVEDTSIALPLTKRLEGRGWREDDAFKFVLEPVSVDGRTDEDALAAAPMPEGGSLAVVTPETPTFQPVGSEADPAVKVFGYRGFTFSAPGTYVYRVREVVPDEAVNPAVEGGAKRYGDASASERSVAGWCLDGMTYDVAEATVTVEVVDDGMGRLSFKRAEMDPEAAPTFVNAYREPVAPPRPDPEPPVGPGNPGRPVPPIGGGRPGQSGEVLVQTGDAAPAAVLAVAAMAVAAIAMGAARMRRSR